MSESRQQSRTTGVPGPREPSVPEVVPPEPVHSAWAGWVTFAGITLVLVGVLHLVEGIVALTQPDHYLVSSRGLIVQWDYTTWGWIHLILGLVAIASGIGIIAGQTWARVIGVILAVLSAITNLAFIAAYPVWSIMIIAFDVIAIYALVVHGRKLAE